LVPVFVINSGRFLASHHFENDAVSRVANFIYANTALAVVRVANACNFPNVSAVPSSPPVGIVEMFYRPLFPNKRAGLWIVGKALV
jgi:hypothetical protein